jgi:hypothetical protein
VKTACLWGEVFDARWWIGEMCLWKLSWKDEMLKETCPTTDDFNPCKSVTAYLPRHVQCVGLCRSVALRR